MKSKKRIIIFIVFILILILFLSYFFNKENYFQDYITFFKLYEKNKVQSNVNSIENLSSNNMFDSDIYFDNYNFKSKNQNSSNQNNNYNLYIEPLEMQMTTVNLMDTVDSKTLVHEKIAPGTRGSFNINLDAGNSDVGINYLVKFPFLIYLIKHL